MVLRRIERKQAWSLLPILLLSIILRIYHLGYKSIWYDEGVSFFIAREANRWSQFIQLETAQPLYYILLFYPLQFLGQNEFWLRSLSLLFGILSIYAGYQLFLLFSNRKIALLTTVFLSISPFQIWHSQDARAYTLFLFLSILSIYFFWKYLCRGEMKDLTFFTLSSILNLFSHYYAVLLLATLYLYLFLNKRKQSSYIFWRLIFSLFLIFASFIPYFLKASLKHLHYPSWQFTSLNLRTLYQLTLNFDLFAPALKTSKLFSLLNILIIYLFLRGCLKTFSRRREEKFSFFCLSLTFSYLFFSFFLSLLKKLYHPRFMIPILPFYFYFISLAILELSEKKRFALLSTFTFFYIFSFQHFESWQQKPDWRSVASCIRNETPDMEFNLLLNPYWTLIPLLYYLPEAESKIVKQIQRNSFQSQNIWLILSYGEENNLSYIKKISKFLKTLGYSLHKKYRYYGIVVYNYNSKNVK